PLTWIDILRSTGDRTWTVLVASYRRHFFFGRPALDSQVPRKRRGGKFCRPTPSAAWATFAFATARRHHLFATRLTDTTSYRPAAICACEFGTRRRAASSENCTHRTRSITTLASSGHRLMFPPTAVGCWWPKRPS